MRRTHAAREKPMKKLFDDRGCSLAPGDYRQRADHSDDRRRRRLFRSSPNIALRLGRTLRRRRSARHNARTFRELGIGLQLIVTTGACK